MKSLVVLCLLCACGDSSQPDLLPTVAVAPAWMTPLDHVADHVAYDRSGNITIATSQIGTDCVELVEITGDGMPRWRRTFEDPPSDPDARCPRSYAQIVVDRDDNLIAIGHTQSISDSIYQGTIVVRKLDSEGATIWTRYHDSGNPGDRGIGVAADEAGNIVAAGSESRTNVHVVPWLAKYTPDGTLAFVQNTDVVFGAWIHPRADRDGNIYAIRTHDDAAGNLESSALYKLDSDGDTVWERLTDSITFALDASGAAVFVLPNTDFTTFEVVEIDRNGIARPTMRLPSDLAAPNGKPVHVAWSRPIFAADGSKYFVSSAHIEAGTDFPNDDPPAIVFAHFAATGEVISLRLFAIPSADWGLSSPVIDARGQIAFGLKLDDAGFIVAIPPDQ